MFHAHPGEHGPISRIRVITSCLTFAVCVPCTLPHATAAGADSRPIEQWLWTTPSARNRETFEWRRTFELEDLPASATAVAYADFCELDLWINDRPAARSDAYEPPRVVDVTQLLHRGPNELRLVSRDLPGPTAIAFRLELHWPDRTRIVVSDQHLELLRDGRDFRPARLGRVAEAVRVPHEPDVVISEVDDYTQWKRALGTRDVTAPSTFVIRPGYEIELLRSAQPDEGSWIALAFDESGRLLVGREDQGLLRMQLDADRGDIERVESVNADLREPRGIAAVGSALFVNANESRGMYCLTDTIGDGRYDETELLRRFPGSAGHGRNNVTLGPDGWLYSIHGDAVEIPREVADRTSPFREHRQGRQTREGSLIRCKTSGESWEVIAAGLRNPFGIAFNSDGEAFTYDADAEHDMGAPWYRPTRVVHLVSGADYGWRGVTGSWPPYFPDHPDNALPNLDVGKGSPTSIAFGTSSRFEPDLQHALFLLDWAYGRILTVRMRPRGASYVCRLAEFVKGRPFNATGLAFGPDGALYVVTGGRKTQSALYRIRFTGESAEGESLGAHELDCSEHAAAQRELRRQIERGHGEPGRLDAGSLGNWLAHADPRIRHAARIALEHIPRERWPVDTWLSSGALPEGDWPTARTRQRRQLQVLLALVRDPDFPDQLALLTPSLTFDFAQLRDRQRLELVYVTRHLLAECGDKLPDEWRAAATAYWRAAFEHAGDELQIQILELLVQLGFPGVSELGMARLAQELDGSKRLHILFALRSTGGNWQIEHRRDYLQALNSTQAIQGGAGLPMFLQKIREEFVATLSESERQQLQDELQSPTADIGRLEPITRSKIAQWTLDDIDELLALTPPANLEQGRELFVDLQCARCHRAGQIGAAVGPDLTNVSRRFDRRGLLESIIAPSRVVDEAYRSDQLVLKDGRVLVGRIVPERDYRSPTLRLIPFPYDGSPDVTIEKADIEQHRKSSQSVMPDGLLNTATSKEIAALLAFLTRGHVPSPRADAAQGSRVD